MEQKFLMHGFVMDDMLWQRANTKVGKRRSLWGLIGLVGFLLLAACGSDNSQAETAVSTGPTISIYAEGLLNPMGMALLPDGSLLVAEEGTGGNDNSAGVSLITANRQVGRFISGLPSGRDSGNFSGVPLVALAPAGDGIYLANYDAGHLWLLPVAADNVTLLDNPYQLDDLGVAMRPLNNVRLIDPFDITFDEDGNPVVTDASSNAIATTNADGTTRFTHRFQELPDPTDDRLTIESAPSGIVRSNGDYLVTLTGGCPHPADSGLLVAIDDSGSQRTLVDGLNLPIDVAQGADGTIWVLEFARFTPGASCSSDSGYQENSGRLSRLEADGTLTPVVENLSFPGAVLPLPDGSLFVSEVFDGRILHITFNAEQQVANPVGPDSPHPQPAYRAISDYDLVLAQAIAAHGLQPNPGAEFVEGDTDLARLGQQLFFDPIMSGDQNISCATCHHPALAMGDGRVLPIGTGGAGLGPLRDFVEQVEMGPEARAKEILINNPFNGQFVPRNSPTILNAALLPAQFWDGRVEAYQLGDLVTTLEDDVTHLNLTDSLATQALFPITSLHEMAGATLGSQNPMQIRTRLVQRLDDIPAYTVQFEALFGRTTPTVTDVAAAMAAFERRFIFTDAPWDAYLRGDSAALTAQQKRGALLFFGELNPAVSCVQCHSGDLFTDMDYHNLLVPQLGPGKGHGENGREDWGRGGVTFDARDQYSFRTPSLRNVTLTAPYFHSGAYATLADVVGHHANIWDSARNYDPSDHVPPAFYSSYRAFDAERQWPTAAPELRNGLPLSEQDIVDLVAFLAALTDPAALDLAAFLPEAVPSGLPLDPVPSPSTLAMWQTRPSTQSAQHDTPAADGVAPVGIRFRNVAADVGLDFQHGAFRSSIYDDPAAGMGAGLCWLDYDNDGWLDLYLVNSHAEDELTYWQLQGMLPNNVLYRNENGRFTDVGQSTRTNLRMRGNGCVAADFNLDGWTDIFVTADGPNVLLWNNGDGTFSEGARLAGVDAAEWNTAAAVGDLNGDGWPDLFVAGYVDLGNRVPNPAGAFPQDYYGLPNRLYVSEGVGENGRVTFREVGAAAGLTRAERSLGAVLSDLDGDGDLDLYLANDGEPNRLYLGEAAADGLGFRLVEVTTAADVGDAGSGMGVAAADWDGDGMQDLFVTNWEAELNALYRNTTGVDGEVAFQYSTFRVGLPDFGRGMTSWGTSLADFDQDGDVDLVVVNGRVPVTNLAADPELVRFYGSLLADGQPDLFREVTFAAGLDAVGPLLARGSAAADFDNDGDLDVAINTIGGQAVLLRNEGEHGNWLQVGLDGFYPGAVVTAVLPDGRELVRELHVGSSYLASEDTRLHFGLGDVAQVAALRVRWLDGVTVVLADVAVNELLVVKRP